MNLDNAKVIDVRTPAEFAGGHVEGSVNIPLNTIHERVDELLAIEQPIVVCCASGGRSFTAYQFLTSKGISNIHDGGSWLNVVRLLQN